MDKQFNSKPNEDRALFLAEKADRYSIQLNSGLLMRRYYRVEGVPEEQSFKVEPAFDAIAEELESIKREFQYRAKAVLDLYAMEIHPGTPFWELMRQRTEHLICMEQLLKIKNLKYWLFQATHAKSKERYDMIKANYISDQGLKTIYNKNIGNVDLTLIDLVVKVFKLLGYEVFEMDSTKKWQLLVTRQQQSHTVEVITEDKKQIMDVFITMSLWKKYQQSNL